MARHSAQPKATQRSSTRCAIYTRKSSEDGLEQAFNSLDAQREACLAYITSQRHEGWTALPAQYDDGGFSGGSLSRPAVQRLLADIRSRKVDLHPRCIKMIFPRLCGHGFSLLVALPGRG
jgi:site-specific DNA recombinase